ncbi:protein PYRICULARIA ORYZAE RESISTANCE 21-like isoform X2 [Lycium barbarum]|uniref:protein PYRICULARIA ORYZAE RESISTANCE 21-like isoform X2 n=1 Tax=Lycium barbarum TaxID=112863 RepID=UPI00293ECE3C|nr:protein PYRICULARIA ORYZAE RESISTANCE 21-like isoform X2 [Lycium barbarum]
MSGDKIEKTTIMVLKVDLQCSSCYKKVKKILCKFPQIRDQLYDEKANTVTITVVCCNPEKIRDKLYSKGCGVIKCIKIKKPKPPPVDPPPQPPPSTPQPVMVVPGYCCCCGQCYGRCLCYHSYGCGRGCRVSRCDWYFIEENTTVCSIM